MRSAAITHPLVSDAVWSRLDPHAGRLSRRGLRRLWLAITLALILIVGFGMAVRAGVVTPQLGVDPTDGDGPAQRAISAQSPAFWHQHVIVTNNGWLAVTITKFGGDLPGARLTSSETLPVRIAPHQQVTLTLTYAIFDCPPGTGSSSGGGMTTIQDTGTPTVPITVRRSWGSQRVNATVDEPDWSSVIYTACRG